MSCGLVVFVVFYGDMFFTCDVLLVLAGDDVFALLICDEDLEYGARRLSEDGFFHLGRFLIFV